MISKYIVIYQHREEIWDALNVTYDTPVNYYRALRVLRELRKRKREQKPLYHAEIYQTNKKKRD